MHGQLNIKIFSAKQAKQIFQYKKIKIKLYKNNAAIWYNKTCRIKQLTPNYINVRVTGNNTRSQKNEKYSHPIQNKPRAKASPSSEVAQDGHLQRVTIPEAAYVQFASLTS